MKKKIVISLLILVFVGVISIIFINVNFKDKSVNKKENLAINISTLSEEYMTNYLDEVKNTKEEDKENILIVTSEKKLKETYGAVKVIPAPNNQYYLQYKNAEDKNKALKEFEDLSISVSENIVHELSEDTVLVSTYNSWGVEAMGIDDLLEKASDYDLNEVTVAIIDTGLDVELFNKNYLNRLAGYYNVVEDADQMNDEDGHGTHIAGTIAEATPSNVKIMPIKVSNTKRIYTSDIIAGINYVTYNNCADVMNMSFSSSLYSNEEYIAIEAAKQEKILSVAAAGNDNTFQANYPAAFSNTIAISAVDQNKEKADFSNYGDYIMFAAPGVDILSINGTMSGTSMATPHSVSAVALLKSLNKELTFKDIVTILRRYSLDLGDEDWDQYYGYGFINFENAQICDGADCDEFNVFKQSENDNIAEIVEIMGISDALSSYDYGTINNILNRNISLKYSNGETKSYLLYDLPNVEITGYDPNYYYSSQTINIKFTTPLGEEVEDTVKIWQEDLESVWDYNILDDNTIELTNFKDTEFSGKSLYIPSEIDGYQVSAIADQETTIFADAWDAIRLVNNLYLPETLTRIGNNAFYDYDDGSFLSYVKSEAKYLEIGDNAFRNAQALISVDANVSYIGDNAFNGDQNFMHITTSNDLTYIGNNAFYNNKHLKNIDLGENLKYIGISAFEECRSLGQINFPQTLEEIGDYAFKNAFDPSAEVKLTIPKSVTKFGSDVFESNYSSTGITEITFLNNLKTIPKATFFNNNYLEKVTLPKNLVAIDDLAFYKCQSLKEIYFGKFVESINSRAFMNTTNATFYVYENTYPQTFAIENNFDYILLEDEYLMGDMNQNDKIDLTDILLLIKLYFNKIEITDYYSEVGDLNYNNKIDTTDILLLIKTYFGKI